MAVLVITRSVGAAEYTDFFSPNQCPDYDTKQSNSEVFRKAGALGNIEYPFIAIALRSNLARSGISCQGPI